MDKKKGKKKQSKVGLWISRIVFVVAVCVFVYSAFQIYKVWKVGDQVKQETNEVISTLVPTQEDPSVAVFEPDWAMLQAKNPEIMGFIVVPDTHIFYPIVYKQGDNDFYLNHTAFLQNNYLGGIFLDGNSSGDLTTPSSIIYGHNILNETSMFSDLSKFFEPEFASTHPYVYIFTPNGNYRTEVVSAYRTTTEDDIYNYVYSSHEQMNDYIARVRSLSEVAWTGEYPEDTNYVTLSTCSFDQGFQGSDVNRYLLHAALIPWDGELLVPLK